MTTEKKFKSLQVALSAMKSLSVEQQKSLILNLIKKDPTLAKELLHNMFEFEDIVGFSRADFKFVWFEIPRKTWHFALRGASDQLMLFVQTCLTQRAFDELISDLKLLGPQPKTKVLEAQQTIVDELQTLMKQGRIQRGSQSSQRD